ncbi:phosphoribosyltransferase [Nocardiopsis sp. CNT-189]|uniref:phosphoribosyltransferase n=1 Tax=Nocardiopsis oceanisediminis TaxID=2816862 RepID=UPI003B308D42
MRRSVAEQSNYLNPALSGLPEICPACFGAMPAGRGICGNCVESRTVSGGVLADVVAPITYRVGYQGQGAHDLRAYKADPASSEAKLRLTCLFWDFCSRHLNCVKARLGITGFTHVAFVPSTKRPGGVHPLQAMLSPLIPLKLAPLRLNSGIDSALRSMNTEWFAAEPLTSGRKQPSAVLLLEDTWVSGARAQSAAHSLKKAGAERVGVITLARQLNPDYAPAQPIIKELGKSRYDPERCVWH